MIADGTTGTVGLQSLLTQALSSTIAGVQQGSAQAAYIAARLYNTGSLSGDDLAQGGITPCYSSDIANRMMGWVDAPNGCTLGGN